MWQSTKGREERKEAKVGYLFAWRCIAWPFAVTSIKPAKWTARPRPCRYYRWIVLNWHKTGRRKVRRAWNLYQYSAPPSYYYALRFFNACPDVSFVNNGQIYTVQRVQVEKWLTVFEISAHQGETNGESTPFTCRYHHRVHRLRSLFSRPWKIHRGRVSAPRKKRRETLEREDKHPGPWDPLNLTNRRKGRGEGKKRINEPASSKEERKKGRKEGRKGRKERKGRVLEPAPVHYSRRHRHW